MFITVNLGRVSYFEAIRGNSLFRGQCLKKINDVKCLLLNKGSSSLLELGRKVFLVLNYPFFIQTW